MVYSANFPKNEQLWLFWLQSFEDELSSKDLKRLTLLGIRFELMN